MRYKKRFLRVQRSKDLPIQFVNQDMTTFAGLTFVGHLFRLYQLHRRLKKSFENFSFSGDYQISDILFMVVIMLILGVERLSHIEYLRDDPLFKRIVRMSRIPHRTKISSSLKHIWTRPESKREIYIEAGR